MRSAAKNVLWRQMAAIAVAMACLVLSIVPGAAESLRNIELLNIDISINPSELVGPGDATVTFILTNRSDYDIQNIYLSSPDGLLSEPVGQLGVGETQTLMRQHAVTEEELQDGAVRYVISHDAPEPGGEKVSRMLSAYVNRGVARPEVDFTRQLSSRDVAPGGQLTVTYRLTNSGNVPVTDLKVTDALGDFSGRLERLDVGATRTFISRLTVNAEVQSEARLEYSVASGETVSRELDPVTVRLSESALDAAFSIGRSVFDADRADAVLVLTNAGDDDYTGIAVTDDVYGGVIADGVTLPGGGNSREIAYTYPMRGGGEYRWRVTGISQSGEALDFVTETLTLEGEDAPGEISVRLSARARATRINRPGRVTFDLELQNTGNVMARELRVYEIERGEVRTLAVLPTGEPTRCQVTYPVDESDQFIFCVGYTDADGHLRTASADPIQVEITPAGIAPEPEPGEAPALTGGSVKLSTTSTFTVLLVVASAALVSMFTLLLVTSLRARRERLQRMAARRQRQRNEATKAGTSAGRHRRRRKQGGASDAQKQEKDGNSRPK